MINGYQMKIDTEMSGIPEIDLTNILRNGYSNDLGAVLAMKSKSKNKIRRGGHIHGGFLPNIGINDPAYRWSAKEYKSFTNKRNRQNTGHGILLTEKEWRQHLGKEPLRRVRKPRPPRVHR